MGPSSETQLKASTPLTVSVVVPVYNGGTRFFQCLNSLSTLQPPPLEVIVAADGDTDGSSQLAAQHGFTVVRLSDVGGPARARNVGARHARGDILLFVDADVTVPTDLVGRMATLFTCHPELDAIIGSYDDEPEAKTFVSQYKNLLHHYVHQTACEEASTFWGACGAIRRAIFERTGGFDERYGRPSIEDIELGYRLKRAGSRICMCKTLQVKHLKQWKLLSLIKADVFDRAIPWTEMIWQHGIFLNDLNTRVSGRMSVIATFVFAGTACATGWYPELAAVAFAMGLLLVTLNAPIYLFFFRKRGPVFALRAIPLHWTYFFYSGAAFLWGSLRYFLVTRRPAPLRAATRNLEGQLLPATKIGRPKGS